MSDQYRIRQPEAIHFVTFTIVDWVDLFTRPVYKQAITDSLNFCSKYKGLQIYAWCLMTNHLHLLIAAKENYYLPDIIRDFKKHTSKQLVKLAQTEPESRRQWIMHRFEFHARFNARIQEYKVWQDGYHGIECYDLAMLEQKLTYIHQNPVRAGIVTMPENYLYSSATDYAGQKGLVEVEYLEFGFA